MTDLDHALEQLAFIHERVVAGTRFQGLAPHAVAGTGVLALTVATAQTLSPGRFASTGTVFVWTWVAAAAIAAGLIGVEALERAQRLHGGLADRMIAGTLRLLLPFGVVGAVITLVIVRTAPEAIWMLPGLWQLLVALIGFAALGTLPRTIVWPAGWYLAGGTMTLLLAARSGVPSPWTMGLPFGIGQLLVALILHKAGRRDGAR